MVRNVSTLIFVLFSSSVFGFGVIGEDENGIAARWDAAPRTLFGEERSLDGGLRYSLAGGDYQSYRDMFTWSSVPSVAAFQDAVQDAFIAWTATDSVSGLGTSLTFFDDTSSTSVASGASAGAEIDLFAGAAIGSGVTGGETTVGFVTFTSDVVTMTTGDIRGLQMLSGADIVMNNVGAVWTLSLFQDVLTHEIGHSIGLADVELAAAAGTYIDDNFDGTTNSLLNSFAGTIDPDHPESTSGIQENLFAATLFDSDNVASGAPFLLMETDGDSGAPSPAALDNDSFAGRQYLYPVAVPEPGAWLMMCLIVSVASTSKLLHLHSSRGDRRSETS